MRKGIKYTLISIILIFILSIAFYFSVPKTDFRFKTKVIENNLLLLDESAFLSEELVISDVNNGFNGKLLHKVIEFDINKKASYNFYIFVHSLKKYSKYGYEEEFIEYQFKLLNKKTKKQFSYINAYRLKNKSEGFLFSNIIDLKEMSFNMEVYRKIKEIKDKIYPVTAIKLKINSDKYDEFIWDKTIQYYWKDKFVDKLWLSEYDESSDEYRVYSKFQESLFL